MKKLLLHIGYPKTATTTLQQQVFTGLHVDGHINYLGRVQKNKLTNKQKKLLDITNLVGNLRKHLVLDESFEFSVSNLSEDRLNVISDEDLTLHGYFHEARFNVNVDPFDYPNKLKNILGENVNVDILITLRNQPDLIFSCFAQKYPFIRSISQDVSFNDFITKRSDSFFDLFKFEKVIDLYQKTFNAKITVSLFEDFIVKPEDYWQNLSRILPSSPEELKAYQGTAHLNRKEKTKTYINTYYCALTPLGKIIAAFYGGNKELMYYLNKRHNLNSFASKKYEVKMLLKILPEQLCLPKESEKNYLKELFRNNNHILSEKYNISLDKLRTYNYL